MTNQVKILYPIDKVKGCLFGLFVGDALGVEFIGNSADMIPPLDLQYIQKNPPKFYTNDTQMMISVLEEMIENGKIDQASLQNRFLSRFASWRGYSGGMLEVFNLWKEGVPIDSAAKTLYGGLGSFGNGAAVRSVPISLFYTLKDVDLLFTEVKKCALLTHTHAYGIAGALLQVYVILLALNRIPMSEWTKKILALPIDSAFKIKMEKVIFCLQKNASPQMSALEIGTGSDAIEAVSSAIYAVLRNQNSFLDALLFAISMGGDTNTIGAMAGSIAGAWWGIQQIPVECLKNLENGKEGKEFLHSLVENVFNGD